MSIKKYVLCILLVISMFVIGYQNNEHINSDYSFSNDFTILDIDDIDKTLSNQIYAEQDNEVGYVAVIEYKSNNASMKQYPVKNGGIISLTIPKDSKFIISLYANATVAYTWNIKNNLNNEVIQFENRSMIDIPGPASEEIKYGASKARQNFYFKTIKSSREKIVMRYEHQSEQRNEFFEITFNIMIK